MTRYRTLLSVTLCLTVAISMVPAGVVAESPEEVERCSDAPMLDEGTYTGELTPDGNHFFRLDLDEGDYFTAELEFDAELNNLIVDRALPGRDYTLEDSDEYSDLSTGTQNDRAEETEFSDGGESEFWVEENKPVCVQIRPWEPESGGSYQLSIATGSTETPELVDEEEAEQLREENEELESELEDAESSGDDVEELEAEIEDLEAENEDLEAEVEELRDENEELEEEAASADEQATESGDGSDSADSNGGSEAFAPGLGLPVAVVSLVVGALVVGRRD